MTAFIYLAGLFDGEGNAGVFHIQRRKSSPARLASGRQWVCAQDVPCMQLKMTDKDPVKLLHDSFGGSFSQYVIKSGKTAYVWRVTHRKALAAALALRPHSRNLAKHEQLDKVINYYQPLREAA
jgi:hypothetical protein